MAGVPTSGNSGNGVNMAELSSSGDSANDVKIAELSFRKKYFGNDKFYKEIKAQKRV